MCCAEEEDWKVRLCGMRGVWQDVAAQENPQTSAPSRKRRTQLSAASGLSAAHQSVPRSVVSRRQAGAEGMGCGASPALSLSLLAGTRSAVLNTEARTVEADVLSRRCVMMRLVDFSYEQYQKALRQSAGAVVIILPRSISSVPQDVVRVNKKSFLSLPVGGILEKSSIAAGLEASVGMYNESYSNFKTSLCALVVNFFLTPLVFSKC